MASNLGAVLNELGDALSDLGLYLPLAFVDARAQWPVTAFAIGAVLTEFCGVTARALGASRRYDGPMGKSDRAFLVGALGLITWISGAVLAAWFWVFTVAALLTLLTCGNRLHRALAELAKAKASGG
jgi:phosphatidylglycerophosphate synthase